MKDSSYKTQAEWAKEVDKLNQIKEILTDAHSRIKKEDQAMSGSSHYGYAQHLQWAQQQNGIARKKVHEILGIGVEDE